MKIELNLKTETAWYIEEQAQKQGMTLQQWIERTLDEKVAQLLAKPPSETISETSYVSDAEFEAATTHIFDKYAHAFDVLSEGAQ